MHVNWPHVRIYITYPTKYYGLFCAQYVNSTFSRGNLLWLWLIASPPTYITQNDRLIKVNYISFVCDETINCCLGKIAWKCTVRHCVQKCAVIFCRQRSSHSLSEGNHLESDVVKSIHLFVHQPFSLPIWNDILTHSNCRGNLFSNKTNKDNIIEYSMTPRFMSETHASKSCLLELSQCCSRVVVFFAFTLCLIKTLTSQTAWLCSGMSLPFNVRACVDTYMRQLLLHAC